MTNEQLANILDDIAQGNMFSASALALARDHSVTTTNDRQMLTRYLMGAQQCIDWIRLQELAIYIREAQ